MRALSQEEKVALAMCFCLIVVELFLLLYIGTKDRRPTYYRYVEILGPTWNGNSAVFTVKNIESPFLTILEVRVNDGYAIMIPSVVALNYGDQTKITVTRTGGFLSGEVYEFTFITANGSQISHTATAP